eukprot:g1333.t1
MDIQTDSYLEELTDRPPERDSTTQTDPLMDRPPSPLFMPAKTGVDKETQIEEGDLFHFEVEVAPILEVLVGKTLEQSMDEVLEEEELANIRAQRAKFEQLRNVELAEVQRLEAEMRRRVEEKERRVRQERDRMQREEEVMKKIASRGMARKIFENVRKNVFEDMADEGHFYDPVAREIETTFLPWIQQRASSRCEERKIANVLCDNLINAAVELLPAKIDAARARQQRLIEAAAAAEAAEKDAMDATGEVMLGIDNLVKLDSIGIPISAPARPLFKREEEKLNRIIETWIFRDRQSVHLARTERKVAMDNLSGQIEGLRSLLRHVVGDRPTLKQPFADLLAEVLQAQIQLKSELDETEAALLREVSSSRARVRRAMRAGPDMDNLLDEQFSLKNAEAVIDSVGGRTCQDAFVRQEVAMNFEQLLRSWDKRTKDVSERLAAVSREKDIVGDSMKHFDASRFVKLYDEFEARTARGLRRKEWEQRLRLEFSKCSPKLVRSYETLFNRSRELRSKMKDVRASRRREIDEFLREASDRFKMQAKYCEEQRLLRARLEAAALGQEKRHSVLRRIRAIRVAELKRREEHREAIRRAARAEADAKASVDRTHRDKQRSAIMQYKTEQLQKRKLEEERQIKMEEERNVERKMMLQKNRGRVQFRQAKRREKLDLARADAERAAAAEIARDERLEALKSTVPNYERLQQIQVDRSRVLSDTERFAIYKKTDPDLPKFGSIHGYADDKIWSDVRLRVQAAIRDAGLHQSAFVRSMFAQKLSAPY